MVKSSDFEYENEVRAIFEQKDFEISYYLRHNIIVPYITISLPKDAIRSIWIGPTQDKDRTKMSLDKFLNSQGYNLDIEVSEIDYRDDSNN
jgi:hypothetical protein